MRVLAPAKVNLSLWILGKRNDEYHEILTLFCKIPLSDELIIEECERTRVICEGRSTSNNTVFKALKALSEHVGQKLCLKVRIKKRIPVGGGLGGGSSDAAAVLKSANLIFKLGLTEEELTRLGAKIGADVPFFILSENAAIGRGIGEILEPLNLTLPQTILIFPGFPVSTKLAYEAFDTLGRFTDRDYAESRLKEIVEDIKKGKIPRLENDFERVIFERFPQIAFVKERLRSWGWEAVMSGSGSCVFGIGKGEMKSLDYRAWLFV